jgi:hypothetical protein
MPSERKQVNFRVDGETEELFAALIDSASAALGLRLSQADVFRLALNELAKKYPPAAAEEQPPAPPPPARSARRRKARG